MWRIRHLKQDPNGHHIRPQALECPDHEDQSDPQDNPAHKDFPEPAERQENLASPVTPDSVVLRVPQDPLEWMVMKD